MRKLLLFLVFATPIASAQAPDSVTFIRHGSSLPGTCSYTSGEVFSLDGVGLYSAVNNGSGFCIWSFVGGSNLASPPAIGNVTPNAGTFSTVLNDSDKYLSVNMIAHSLFRSPNVISRTLVTNTATNLGYVDTSLALQIGVVANGYTWNTQCPNGGRIQGFSPQFAFGLQAQSLICDVNANTTFGQAVLGLAGNLTTRPTTTRGNIGVLEMDSLTHTSYSLGWDYLGTTAGSEFFNWGGLFTNVANGKGGVGVLVKSNFWNGGSPSYGTWTANTELQTASTTQPTSPNGYWYQVTTPNALPTLGTTGSREPTWCTAEGCTVIDGTIEWTGHAKSGEGTWQIGYRAEEWLGAAYDCVNDVTYSTGYCMMLRSPDNSYPLNFAFARGNPSTGTRWVMGITPAPYTDWFSFYSAGDNLNRFTMKPGAETRLSSAGTQPITLNMDVNSGTGGVQFGSGGMSPTATASVDASGNYNANSYRVGGTTVVDPARNATVNDLTVNGTCTGCGSGDHLNVITRLTSYTTAITDDVILISSASATMVTLTTSELISGKIYRVKNIGSGAVTIQASSGSIDGSSSVTLPRTNMALSLIFDGTDFQIF